MLQILEAAENSVLKVFLSKYLYRWGQNPWAKFWATFHCKLGYFLFKPSGHTEYAITTTACCYLAPLSANTDKNLLLYKFLQTLNATG